MTRSRAALAEEILAIVHSEIQDKTMVLRMDMPIEEVKMDSLDVINILFKLEERFKTEVEVPTDPQYATLGEFVNLLIDKLPPQDADGSTSSAAPPA